MRTCVQPVPKVPLAPASKAGKTPTFASASLIQAVQSIKTTRSTRRCYRLLQINALARIDRKFLSNFPVRPWVALKLPHVRRGFGLTAVPRSTGANSVLYTSRFRFPGGVSSTNRLFEKILFAFKPGMPVLTFLSRRLAGLSCQGVIGIVRPISLAVKRSLWIDVDGSGNGGRIKCLAPRTPNTAWQDSLPAIAYFYCNRPFTMPDALPKSI